MHGHVPLLSNMHTSAHTLPYICAVWSEMRSDTQDVSFSWLDVSIIMHREWLIMFSVCITEYLRVHPRGKNRGRSREQLCVVGFPCSWCLWTEGVKKEKRRESLNEIDAKGDKECIQVSSALWTCKVFLTHPRGSLRQGELFLTCDV